MKEVRARTQSRNVAGGTEAGTVGDCCLLDFWPWLAYISLLFIKFGATGPGVALPKCAGPSDINRQSWKCLIDVPIDQYSGSDYTIEVSSSQVTIICIKWAKLSRTWTDSCDLNFICPPNVMCKNVTLQCGNFDRWWNMTEADPGVSVFILSGIYVVRSSFWSSWDVPGWYKSVWCLLWISLPS